MKLSRVEAIRILWRATEVDDQAWQDATEDFYDEKNDDLPTIMDTLVALGVTKDEFCEAAGANGVIDWPGN